MVSDATPSERAVLYAVDQVRRRVGLSVDYLDDDIADLGKYEGALWHTLRGRSPEGGVISSLDDVTRWGGQFLARLSRATLALKMSRDQLASLGGQATRYKPDSDEPMEVTAIDDWLYRFGDQLEPFDPYESSQAFYDSRIKEDDDGQHQVS